MRRSRPRGRGPWARLPVGLAALLTGALLLTACTDERSGTPQAGSAPPMVTAVDWTGSPTYTALSAIPASFASKYHISLIDPAPLNLLERVRGNAGPTTPASAGGRPRAESAWVSTALSTQICADALDDRSGSQLRTGPPDKVLSVWFGGTDAEQKLGICQGETNPAWMADADIRGGAVIRQEVGGVDGYQGDDGWAGYRSDPPVSYLIGAAVPDDVRSAIVGGSTTTASLADDRQVRAVLDAAPHAAMIDMGTVYLEQNPVGPSDQIVAALHSALTDTGVVQLPVAEFAGYGWTPGVRVVGTAVFVTTYGSTQEAATVQQVLNALWPKIADTQFAGARTAVDGQVVVTTLPEVGPDEFAMRDRSVLGYPAFLSGS